VAHFLKYWKWPTVQPRYDEAVPTLRNMGSRQFSRVAPGDVIWMVTVQPVTDILFLVGKLTVGWVGDRDTAAQLLGNPRLWDAPFHVIAREVCEGSGQGEPFKEISLRAVAADLRFISPGGRDRLRTIGGRVHPTQLQTMRQLSAESAQRLTELWDAAPAGRSPEGSGADRPETESAQLP
jgi:hypothetical protein